MRRIILKKAIFGTIFGVLIFEALVFGLEYLYGISISSGTKFIIDLVRGHNVTLYFLLAKIAVPIIVIATEALGIWTGYRDLKNAKNKLHCSEAELAIEMDNATKVGSLWIGYNTIFIKRNNGLRIIPKMDVTFRQGVSTHHTRRINYKTYSGNTIRTQNTQDYYTYKYIIKTTRGHFKFTIAHHDGIVRINNAW